MYKLFKFSVIIDNKVKTKRENVASDTNKTVFDLNKTEKLQILLSWNLLLTS